MGSGEVVRGAGKDGPPRRFRVDDMGAWLVEEQEHRKEKEESY